MCYINVLLNLYFSESKEFDTSDNFTILKMIIHLYFPIPQVLYYKS